MADSSGGGPPRGQRISGSPTGSFRSVPQNARQPISSQNPGSRSASYASSVHEQHSGDARSPLHSLQSQDSRFSLNEQFATSRRDYEFDADDDDYMTENGDMAERLQPAPRITDDPNIAGEDSSFQNSEDEIDDAELQALLHAVDESVDYYTLLGLTRDPSPSTTQIRAAYHRLSLAFHPDKHPQRMKAAAEKYFTRLQRAYEVLIEPRKRVIYDLEGEFGVQNEYRAGGAMSDNLERQIGVKAMNAEEFRAYYVGILKARERKAVNELVGAAGGYKVTLDASKLFDGSKNTMTFNPEDGVGQTVDVALAMVSLSAVSLRQSFGVPLVGLGRYLQSLPNEVSQDEDDSQHLDSQTPLLSVPKMTFAGSIGGDLNEMVAVYHKEPGAPTVEHAPDPVHWQTLQTDRIALATGIEYVVPGIKDKSGVGLLSGLLADTSLDATVGIMPKRSLTLGLGKAFQPLEDTRAIYGYMRTTIDQSLFIKPPTFELRLTRAITDNQSGYFQWSSGDFPWSSTLKGLLPVAQGPLWLPFGQALPTCRIGWLYNESKGGLDDPDEDHTPDSSEVAKAKKSSSNSSWHVASMATPRDASLQITYGRDIFKSAPLPRVKSRIMASGDAVKSSPPKLELSPRGVRLHVEGELSLSGSLSGTIRGLRRIGDFTTVGLGVGVSDQQGLFLSLTWKRLGQSISLPIIVLPIEHLTARSIACAVAAPWATYAAIEFVILRPRFRRQRLRLIEKKRKQLAATINRHREEAEEAVTLMGPLVEYKQAYEREQGGLVILKATFGVVDESQHGGDRSKFRANESADVTTAVAALVDNSQLSLPRGLQKSQLVGFWDPAPLSRKVLAVRYYFEGKEHYVEVRGINALRLPMRDHEV